MELAQVLLGEDGRGYELARRLEASGVWRAWLGDTAYAAFTPSLASPSAWESFMASSSSSRSPSSKAQIHLQLRARALLFDKASVALFLRRGLPSSLASVNPAYLQLHGDDVYFSLEDDASDGGRHQDGSAAGSNQPKAKTQSRQASTQSKVNGYFYDRASSESAMQKHRHDELPDLWYDLYIEKHKRSSPHKFPFGDGESLKRTSEGMSSYLKQLDMHKRRRQVFKEDHNPNMADHVSRIHADLTEAENLIPEIMFPSNCVPDNAISPLCVHGNYKKLDVYGVLDSLPQLISPSQAMIERFGIRPEYIRVEFGRSKYRGKDGPEGIRKTLSQEQASQLTQKVVARTLATTGADGGTEVLMEVLSQFLGSHINKLGCILKLLSDSYRKQFSSTELIKMFLKTAGYSNLGSLSDYVKDSNRVVAYQNQQQMRSMQQHQGHILQTPQQQVQRPMQTQLNSFHSQNLVFQQQMMQQQQQQQMMQQQLRRRQISAARSSNMIENDRPMVEVKLENMTEPPIDMNRQLQFRQQQMAMANANHQAQSGHQFKQFNSVQVPQLQAQGSFNVRSQPMKVEGFQELMGGDSTLKHESDERRLTSPSK